MQRAQLESHIECATKSHLDLACGKLWETQEKLKEKITHFDKREDRVNNLYKQLEEKVNDIQHQHQCNVGSLRQQQNQRHDTLQAQLKQEVNTCQTKLGQKISMERKMLFVLLLWLLVVLAFYLTRLEVSVIQSLHKRVMKLEENRDDSNSFIWKITSFEEKLTQAKKYQKLWIDSVPFHAFGYKLKIQLWPNGVRQNTHLSILIVVTKGEDDAILPWGFSKRVKFTLIDQQDNLNLRQNVVTEFTADPNNKAFKKPVDGETRVGYGSYNIVSHNDLRKRRFLVDDTLFIQVQVDSP